MFIQVNLVKIGCLKKHTSFILVQIDCITVYPKQIDLFWRKWAMPKIPVSPSDSFLQRDFHKFVSLSSASFMDGINHTDVFVTHIIFTKQKCFSYNNSNNNNIMIVELY